MASVQIKLPEKFALKLSALGNRTDEIIPKILEAGGEVMLKSVRTNLESVIGTDTKYKSRSIGQLAASLGLSPAKQKRDGSGWDIKIGFAEKRSDKRSNTMIANVIEYGKHGQPPKPFLKPAKQSGRRACYTAMKKKSESEVNKA